MINQNKLSLIKFSFAISLFFMHSQCLAQPDPTAQERTYATVTDDNANTQGETTQPPASQPQPETDTEKVKYSSAFKVLGREFTQREKDSNQGTFINESLRNILAGEQRLVIVRALDSVEAEDSVKLVLSVYTPSKLQTYSELIDYFKDLIEKYGSVKAGIESVYVYNIKDEQEAFKIRASKAYETVFGIPEDKQNKEEIFTSLTQSNPLTYSKMVETLLQKITPDTKKQILFTALDQVGRPDLKGNDQFIKKLLDQQFTHATLMRLLKELPAAQPSSSEKK